MYSVTNPKNDSYFDNFVENASIVPIKIKSNLNLIREHDDKCNCNIFFFKKIQPSLAIQEIKY